MEKRDYNDPEYKKWRTAVYQRDGYKCVLCGLKKKLEAHHVKRWADNVALRFQISNGVTLCKCCHKKVTGHEQAYEKTFNNIIYKDDAINIEKMIREYEP